MERYCYIIGRLIAVALLWLTTLPVLADDDDTPADTPTDTPAETTVPLIKIGGDVYGGGNAGVTNGNTSVTIYSGDLNNVYGGARMANVEGNAFVHIDGEHASSYIVINKLFGGNDISGTIGTSEASTKTVPFTPAINTAAVGTEGQEGYVPAKTIVDDSYSAFVRITSKTNPDGTVADDNQKIYIGQMFGGGNGDYDYTTVPTEATTTTDPETGETVTVPAVENPYYGKSAPELAKTYLEVMGGSIVYAFGGGNNATVTEKTTIHVDNPSAVVNHILVNDAGEEADAAGYTTFETSGTLTGYHDLLTTERLRDDMGINLGFSYPSSAEFQIGSFFGGNNTAEMKIRPTWNLLGGKIRNLYSGGNRGKMTSPDGLLLQIAENSTIEVDNVYGGCRMADVIPMKNGSEQEVADPITKDDFGNPLYIPGGMSARTRILGGHVNNVYGGNDITGRVAGGNTVGVYATVYGDIYGGGNGSYPYTDNPTLANDPTYGDLYYDPAKMKGREAGTSFTAQESVEALNDFRPAAEQVSIYVQGTETKKTIVHGGIYLGGNSASLSSAKTNPLVELKIGSHVIADNVFLGNNGEHMVEANEEEKEGGVTTRREGVLRTMQSTTIASDGSRFSSLDLTDSGIFAQYMDGVTMTLMPRVVFAKKADGDPSDYTGYTSAFGSFYCGGNVGSMKIAGKTTINFNHKVIIYNKLVGGCNNADVPEQFADNEHTVKLNAAYAGGLLGASTDAVNGEGLYADSDDGNIKDRMELNLSGLLVRPMRWKMTELGGSTMYTDPDTGQSELEWNTVAYNSETGNVDNVAPVTSGSGTSTGRSSADWHRRFEGGNIYGGCYNSGHVNGNVVININSTIHEPNLLFDNVVAQTADGKTTDKLYEIRDDYTISEYRTGVAMHTQGMDPLGQALNVFGGGKGEGTEIWGSATINLNDGFTFQIFGGSEQGVIGKHSNIAYKTVGDKQVVDGENSATDQRFSTYVNLSDKNKSGSATSSDDLAEAIFIYGGGFEGPIVGNSIVHLDNGRLFNSFAGSCDADILGHTETYIGQNGFPYIRDHTYGGNDLGGTIFGTADFSSRLSAGLPILPYGSNGNNGTYGKNVTQVSAYTEYMQGRVDYIFGGCYGDYDYSTTYDGYTAPDMDNAFVNFKPNSKAGNEVSKIFGAGQGASEANLTQKNEMQNRSYVLIDIADESLFNGMEVFGAGQNCGVGMGVAKATADANADGLTAAAVIDLARGKIGAAYGGSLNEGVTRRTIVNVPGAVAGSDTKTGSTIKIGSIFAGAYGSDIYLPCDVYEGTINYHSADAYLIYDPTNTMMKGALYGGNNQKRRTLYGKINIDVPVRQKHPTYGMTTATVYGAGCGSNTWSEYTEVNLNARAEVYEVYGGGEAGGVMSAESVETYLKAMMPEKDEQGELMTEAKWRSAWTLGGSGYDTDLSDMTVNTYASNTPTNLQNALVREAEIDDRADTPGTNRYRRYNTNVIIREGATVNNYAYGGGLGKEDDTFISSGDVYGTTYIALLGGKVKKDLYAAGTSGSVYNLFGADFIASANAYIKGGTARNVYGGGWAGAVGYHKGTISESNATDISGETHVVIGDLDGTSFVNGIPAIERNAYGGGEGGPVYGTANVTMNRGYIGYRYFDSKESAASDYAAFASAPKNSTAIATDIPTGVAYGSGYYQEKLHDETWNGDGTSRLNDSGNIFGGGYIDNSYVDVTNVTMLGGHVRNALFGGGEIAAIGRGVINASGPNNSVRTLQGIYKAGRTYVKLYDGHVHRNIFGGGRGYNNLGEGGTLYSDGYVFGQTEVDILGGEVGTDEELAKGNGNVFGGGDIGYVYSAYEEDGKLYVGIKDGNRYDNNYEGYYYAYKMGDNPYIPASYVYSLTDPNWVMKDDEYILTEDCKVLVEPHTRVKDFHVQTDITQTVEGKTVTLHAAGSYITQEELDSIPAAIRATLVKGTNYEDATAVTINGHTYQPGTYVPTDDLQYLRNKNNDAATWSRLDPAGIIIHNAIFAGGNTSSGSDKVYANATSIFGNATASVHDIYHRDLITVGTGHTGGLYGDGNLTFVDGYRGLNITNYGTDYYTIEKEINIDQYHALPEREAAYYELRYMCIKSCVDKDGTRYSAATIDSDGKITTPGSTISADDFLTLFEGINGDDDKPMILADGTPRTDYWKENGVCSRYAGRIMNTIQRADFCGVFGSRMVMQGAQDRVPEIVDYTNYTINRVREVSLNKKLSVITTDAGTDRAQHGNYFGIYNIVNYLGALTSDLDFGSETAGEGDVRTTDNTDTETYGPDSNGQSFYDWKKMHNTERKRNNGNSHNKVALASGVYLELTTEESTGDDLYEKEWGTITGVIELDLINVQTGIGGGFVYARNEHGVRTKHILKHATLTKLNENAITKADFTYTTEDSSKKEWQTSGNFVHSTQTIIDDCYNISGKYKTNYNKPDGVPAHYWYIKGSVYVYDQYISAYTGAPNAYSETVDIPLTITAASHGEMKLLNVQPNLFAFYSAPDKPLEEGKKVIINDVTYYKNDPISYWDWYMLSASEKKLFVPETYVTMAECTITTPVTVDGKTFAAGKYATGTVLLPAEYTALKAANAQVYHEEKKQDVDFDFVFRSSNNMGHNTGYMLTYKVNNPTEWDTWYTEQKDTDHDADEDREKNQTGGDGYENGPTYRLVSDNGALLGQRQYEESNVISEETYNTYQNVVSTHSEVIPTNDPTADNYDAALVQATFEPAYIITAKVDVPEGSTTRHLNLGTVISQSYLTGHDTDHGGPLSSSNTAEALVCTSTIQISSTEYIYINSKMSEAKKASYVSNVTSDINGILPAAAAENITKLTDLTDAQLSGLTAEQKKKLASLLTLRNEIKTSIVPAYYCTSDGLYGGNYYEAGKNYRGLEAWSSMSAKDREQFRFNYDALDLLIDPDYGGVVGDKWQYDADLSEAEDNDDSRKALAESNAAGYSLPRPVNYTATYNGTTALDYKDKDNIKHTIAVGAPDLTRAEYELIPNEKRHYSAIKVESTGTYYVVNTPFQVGSTPYAVGTTISDDNYKDLPESDKRNITQMYFDTTGTYYYCREAYTIGENGEGHNVKDMMTDGTGDYLGKEVLATTLGDSITTNVPVGTVISDTNYNKLVNKQVNFTIHGIAPTETSTLYVSRNSDIFDLSTEKIITVIYQYDYEESDSQGNITPVSERHVVNIHVEFKSGIPVVEAIKAPQTVIPGDNVSLREPNVTPGAYEIMGGGWEIFQDVNDAESHTNGVEYSPNFDPLYWYQNGYYVAYYAKTYLGKTYSNHVPLSVANYHDMDRVMQDKTHHLYVDNPDVKRNSKIYIDNRTCLSDPTKSELDLLSDLFDLSVLSGSPAESSPLAGHALLNSRVSGCQHLDFILNSDVAPKAYTAADGSPAGPGWTPVGTAANCFGGWLHGNGFTVSGLDHSLFGHLCGNIYNVGVMGSFTSGGIADSGSGHIENTWVSTTATPTGKPIIADTSGDPVVYNSYYPKEQQWTAHTVSGGSPAENLDIIERPTEDFVNGQVAYLLNSNYLQARYLLFGNKSNATDGTAVTRPVFFSYPDGTIEEKTENGETQNVPYTLSYTNSTADWPWHSGNGFVEDYMGTGDFRFSDGIIPKNHDVSYTVDADGKEKYIPVFPDDYIYFGQTLSYDLYGSTERPAHDLHPMGIVKDHTAQSGDDVDNSRHLLLTLDTRTSNRVFRAPAYFRNGTFGKSVLFNASAAFAGSYTRDAVTYTPHKGLTAIDLSGQTDIHGYQGVAPGTEDDYKPHANNYAPLLDYYGLTAIKTDGITRNLLAYAPTAGAITGTDEGTAKAQAAATSTLGVLTSYFNDPEYAEMEDDASTGMKAAYRAVDIVKGTDLPKGHLVTVPATVPAGSASESAALTATTDHLLVDREDFNAPFSYTFATGKRMWYQRTPDTYAETVLSGSPAQRSTIGWEGISLPFSAELVTTQQKGEITHFYSGSKDSYNDVSTKIGHEYWLREFKGSLAPKKDDDGNDISGVYEAAFGYPVSSSADDDKVFKNSFLWDYYYSYNASLDLNGDSYKQENDFYKAGEDDVVATYADYAYAAAATPYIVGFPGADYLEFDLSGTFRPTTAASVQPQKLDQQVITFASAPGITIGVSDSETGVSVDDTGISGLSCSFRTNYLRQTFDAGTADTYTLNATGGAYTKVPAASDDPDAPVAPVTVEPFRPYITLASTAGGREARSIVFSDNASTSLQPDAGSGATGALSISTRRHVIIVASTLATAADVRITNTAGVTVAAFTIASGETVETRVHLPGIYIVQSAAGRLQGNKLIVK